MRKGLFSPLVGEHAFGDKSFCFSVRDLATEPGMRLNFMCWAKVQVLPVANGPWRPRRWGEWAAQLFAGTWLFPFIEQCINLSVFALIAQAVISAGAEL